MLEFRLSNDVALKIQSNSTLAMQSVAPSIGAMRSVIINNAVSRIQL